MADELEADVATAVDELAELLEVLDGLRLSVVNQAGDLIAKFGAAVDRTALIAESAAGVIDSAEGVAQQVRAAMGDDLQEFQADGVELANLLADVDGALNGVAEELQTLTALAEQSMQQAEELVTEFADTREAAFDDIAEGVSSFAALTSQYRNDVNERIELFKEELTTAAERVETLLEECRNRIDEEFVERIRDLQTEVDGRLRELQEHISSELVPQAIETAVSSTVGELRQVIDDAIESLGAKLQVFGESLVHSTEEGSDTRAITEPAVDQLRVAMDPVFQEIDRIKGLASSIGFSI